MPFSATRDLWLVLKARDEGTRAMRSFSRDIRMVGDSVKQANLQAARSALQNQMAMQRLTGASKNDIIATQKRIETIDKEINGMRVARAAMEENRVSAQKLGSALTGAATVMAAVGTGMIIAGGLGTAAMGNLIRSAIDYQKQSSLTRTQVDNFASSLKDVEEIGLRVANKIGVPFQQIQPALFDIFSSMEVGAKDAEKLLTTFAKAAVAGQTDISSASRATIGIMNAFQLPLSSVNHLMDVQFQLVKEGIGTYEEWTQRIGLVSPSAVRAGQSVEMMAAALAASTRMGISAARSGTAVARAMDAISNPKAVAALKQLGVNALDASGKFRPMIDILRDFRTVIEKVPQAQKIKTILDVFKGAGGTIEARRFLQNMLLTPGNLELFQNIFETMSKTSGSFEQAYSIMADAAATKSELLANKWEILKVKAGEALIPVFLKIVDVVGKLLDWFNKLDPKTQRMIALGVALGLALMTLSGILLIILGSFVAFAAAVAVAGSTVFVVLGILTALGAGFAALATFVVLAWQKSSDFRDIIKDLAKQIGDFYRNYMIPAAIAVRDAWQKYMEPALQALVSVISTKVMPILKVLIAFFSGEVFKAIMELGNNIKDVVIFVFKQLAETIKKFVVPAIELMTKFYREHKQTIDQIIQALVFLGKWLLKIALILGGVLAVVLIGQVVVAFGVVIGVIAAVVAVITYLVEAIKWLVHWIGEEAPKAWQGFMNVVMSVINAIAAAWNYFWNTSIGGLIKAVWDLIIAIVKLGITTIVFFVEWGLKIISDRWNFIWSIVSGVIVAVWNFISPYLKEKWQTLVQMATIIWDVLRGFFVGFWNLISKIFVNAWDNIFGFFSGLVSRMFHAGENIVQGLIDGITGKVKDVTKTIEDLTKKIRDHFPFSPAKIGPLSGRGSPFIAGQNIGKMIAQGMASKMDLVSGMTNLMASASGVRAPNLNGVQTTSNTYHQQIVIHTQELNPRRQAAELGWLLAGRL